MLGWICYEEEGKKAKEHTALGGAAVLILRVPRGKGPRGALGARRAARLLVRKRVRLAALPPDYPYADLFLRRGVGTPDTAALYRACAAKIVHFVLRENGISPRSAGVALLACSASAALQRAAHELSGSVRYLTLRVPNGEKLARELRWEYGIAVQLLQEGEMLRADLAVSFDDARAAGCMLLPLADKRLTVSLCARIEGKDCTDTALLAALVSADALKAEDIRVERVIFPLSPNFP